jgi:hypothetical protein
MRRGGLPLTVAELNAETEQALNQGLIEQTISMA